MKATKILRDQLGLSQEQMAQYLSIPRSQLSLYEIGRRELPLQARVKLSVMEEFLQKPPSKKKSMRPHVKLHREKTRMLLESHLTEQQYQEALAERKLATTKKLYAQNLLMLDMVDHIRTKNTNAALSGRDAAWLNVIELVALEAMENSGQHIQAMLQLKISGIQHQYQQAAQLKNSL